MANFRLAVYPAGAATPTYTISVGWSGSPVYTDSDTDPGTGSTYQFVPDISGLSAGTSYDAYAVREDGSTVVGPVSALGWSTTSAGITGTLSVQESGADSFAGSAAIVVAGNFVSTETGSDTLSASGAVTVSGTFAAAETGSDTFSAIGVQQVSGIAAASEAGSDIAAFSGQIIVSGGFTATESGEDTFQAGPGGYTITFAQAQLLSQIYLLHGLGSPLSVAPTSRTVAGLSQEITSLSGAVTVKTLAQEPALAAPVGTMLEELAALHGLTVDLVVTPTSRTAGGISQAFTTVGSQTTITRQ